jgi:tRNA uridine 5-carboxymethylaminomethyl modification enzyme
MDREELEAQVKYAGYLRRAERERALLATGDALRLPADLRFEEIAGLSNEARQKLSQHRPRSLGEASRISGITPAALGVIAAFLARGSRSASEDRSTWNT